MHGTAERNNSHQNRGERCEGFDGDKVHTAQRQTPGARRPLRAARSTRTRKCIVHRIVCSIILHLVISRSTSTDSSALTPLLRRAPARSRASPAPASAHRRSTEVKTQIQLLKLIRSYSISNAAHPAQLCQHAPSCPSVAGRLASLSATQQARRRGAETSCPTKCTRES